MRLRPGALVIDSERLTATVAGQQTRVRLGLPAASHRKGDAAGRAQSASS
jgi:hypothetical protein